MAMAANKVKKLYEVLRKKYKLPSFDELDAEFEISAIEAERGLLREMRHMIGEKIGSVSAIVAEVLHPDTNLVDLYESRVFDEAEKQKLFELYKRLMVADRTLARLSIANDEKLDADFVNSFTAEWKKLKPELVKFINRLRDSWEKETDDGEAAGYMG